MTDTQLVGRNVLVVERDDVRAGGLIVALRGLGAKAVRFSEDERGQSQARALGVEAVLVDAVLAEDWARPALAMIAGDAALGGPVVVRTDASLWAAGGEPSSDVLVALVGAVARRADRETKSLRVVAPEIAPPSVVVAPSVSAQRVVSRRATEKMGAVSAPIEAPAEVGVPTPAPVRAAPAPAPSGYVFPSRAGGDVEAESSSKQTSLDLTVVPSSLLERANLPITDRYPRAGARPWLPWLLVAMAVLAALALAAAFVTR